MKLVIYNDNEIIQTFEGLEGVEVDGNNITWSTGSAKEINVEFLLLEDDVEVGEEITSDFIILDKKEQFSKIDLVKENAELKARVESAEFTLITLMDMI